MTRISNLGKVVIVGILAAIVIVWMILANTTGTNSGSHGGSLGAANPNAELTAVSPTQTPGNPDAGTGAAAPRTPTVFGTTHPITFITPVKGDLWTIGTLNLIAWTREGGVSGDLYLVNASSGAFVGVISPQTGPHQTSYTWNTRDLLLDRANPAKKDVVPGTYIVKMAFDGNNLPIIASPVIRIAK